MNKVEFINTEELLKWATTNMKRDFDEEEVLKDVDRQYCMTGITIFELPKHMTKSGLPECYAFSVKSKYNPETEGHETIYIF